jgi:hypothetical protein
LRTQLFATERDGHFDRVTLHSAINSNCAAMTPARKTTEVLGRGVAHAMSHSDEGGCVSKKIVLIAVLVAAPVAKAIGMDLLYVNRCAGGCSLKAGADDAVQRKSSILNQDSTIPPFPYDDAAFADTVTCVRSVLAPYDVNVVTVDPGALPRREVILAGSSSDVEVAPGVLGTAPWANGTPIGNVIAFALAEEIGDSVDRLCWITAQQFGTLYGLDHEYHCPEIMSYLTGCGTKTFTNIVAACGEFASRACATSGSPSTQNAAARLSIMPGHADVVFRGYFEVAGPSP